MSNCFCNDCYKKPQQKSILLECGFNPQDAIFEIDDGTVEENQTFVLDRVNVDTGGMCKAKAKIDFSSLIVYEGEDEETYEPEVGVELLFKLERVCNGVADCIQSWKYQKEIDVEDSQEQLSLELEVEISEPFSVTFCDRKCSGCCEYRMVVEGISFEGSFEYLRVVKPVLTVIAQGICEDYCYN